MKAVCALICLALARDIAASIFQRRHYPGSDRSIVQPIDYIVQPMEYLDQRQQELLRTRLQDRKIEVPQPYREDYQMKSTVMNRYADSASVDSSSIENQQKISNLDVFTNQESLVNNKLFAMPRFADPNTPLLMRSLQSNEQALYGDAVAWRGLKIAAAPENKVEEEDIEKIFSEAQKAMKHTQDPETKKKLHEALEVAFQTNSDDVNLNATQLLKKYQYPVEEHTVKTEDGYYLTLFRILPRQQPREVTQRPVVMLMSGLLGSADDWLLMGPGKSLAYMLADAGYDVWLGNSRGSKYSSHVSKHRVRPDFWQFSNDEIALFDLPAMIDYVLLTSNQNKMYYVGYSLGNTAFFALAAARNTYNDKIIKMYALSPMVYMSHVRSPLVRMIAPNSQFYDRLHNQLGNGEFKPSQELVHTMGGAMCENEIDCKHLCSNVYVVMAGVNVESLNVSQIPSIISHLPAGGSTKQMKQYGQSFASRDFRMYDYGSEINQKVYGDILPPKYNMEKVTVPVALYFSAQDWLSNPKDVKRLQKELPNVTDAYMIPEEHFSNMDFQFSTKAPEVVYKRLIDAIQKNYSH